MKVELNFRELYEIKYALENYNDVQPFEELAYRALHDKIQNAYEEELEKYFSENLIIPNHPGLH